MNEPRSGATGTPVVDGPLHLVVVPEGDGAHRSDDAGGGNLRVERLVWSAANTAAQITRFEDVVRREVRSSAAVVVDVRNLETREALALVECAWHAGSLTILRPGPLSDDPAAREQLLQAASLADVVVTSDDSAEVARMTPARVVESFGRDAVLGLIGETAPPQTAMTLSVLITTFDRPAELSACLESLTRQTLGAADFEVVVVDDASRYDVAAVVNGFSERLRTRLVTLPVNSGIGVARAAGAEAATGDVVVLMDDDDIATPRHLAEHLRVHHEMPGEDVVVLGHTAVQPDGRADVLSRHVTHVGHQYFSYDLLRDGDLRTWEWFWGGRSSAKRILMERVAFRGTFMEDADWAERVDRNLRSAGRRLRVVYARRAVQVACSTLPLSAMRRRQTKMALAAAAFQHTTGHDLTRHLPRGLGIIAARATLPASLRRDLSALVATPLCEVRSGPGAAGARRLARLDQLLLTDLSAHHALGLLAADVSTDLRSRGEVPTIAVDAGSPTALAAVTATRPGDQLRVVVRLDPRGPTAQEVTAALEGALAPEGRTTDDLGDVELRVTPLRADELDDADFVLPADPEDATVLRGPLSLFGLHAAEWVTWLSLSGRSAGGLR